MKYKYHGITYPIFFCFKPFFWLWKRICCRRGWHLFDEVWSTDNHYLHCDVCELVVNIESIDTQYTEKKGIAVLASGDGWCEDCGRGLTKSGGCMICRSGPPLSEKDYL